MESPDGLEELGEAGRAAWRERVAATLTDVVAELTADDRAPVGLTRDLATTPEWRSPDWRGCPDRIAEEVGWERALVRLDASHADQEEYVEWRTMRDGGGRLRRIELTTELPDYWEVLAAHAPQRAHELRAAAASGPDDAHPLCHMTHPSNTLRALLMLVASAARPLLVRDALTGRPRFASGREAIAQLGAVADDGRNSDPLVVERVTRLATERRPIAFDQPLGVWISSVQYHELAQPDGADVPAEWLSFERELPAPDGRRRCRRLTFEPPPSAGILLEDLVVRRSGERLRHGGQLAALVQLTVHLRTGPPEIAPA